MMTKRAWLWVVVVLCVASMLGFCSCIRKTVKTEQWGPDVVVVEGSDPIPADLLRHVKVRTNQICQEKGYVGVERLVLFYSVAKQSLEVTYRCFGD